MVMSLIGAPLAADDAAPADDDDDLSSSSTELELLLPHAATPSALTM